MHSNTLQCTPMHSNALQCTPMHSNALQCTPMHSNALQCTPMHSKSSPYTQMVSGLCEIFASSRSEKVMEARLPQLVAVLLCRLSICSSSNNVSTVPFPYLVLLNRWKVKIDKIRMYTKTHDLLTCNKCVNTFFKSNTK